MKLVTLTPETCEAIVAPLVRQHEDITARLERETTLEQARIVRQWRCVEDCTWGWIGEEWARQHPGWEGGQILGRALCHRAAVLLGEDPHDSPWN